MKFVEFSEIRVQRSICGTAQYRGTKTEIFFPQIWPFPPNILSQTSYNALIILFDCLFLGEKIPFRSF